jgi:hypothetical protein
MFPFDSERYHPFVRAPAHTHHTSTHHTHHTTHCSVALHHATTYTDTDHVIRHRLLSFSVWGEQIYYNLVKTRGLCNC